MRFVMCSSMTQIAPRAKDLLAWYDVNRRDLPWRARPGHTANPYHIWLSEIMLQQTSVTATIPYFQKFLSLFPTVQHLANADVSQVMTAWAGLGYYARARNLHFCAQKIARQGGEFPREVEALEKLPGIGPYTARAIAAIAYGTPVVPIDGNVDRVISRAFAIQTPFPAAKLEIAALLPQIASQLEAQSRASDFAQSLFDLGASLCGRTPDCLLCPWQSHCAAHAQGIAASLPRKAEKKPRPTRYGAAFWIQNRQGEIFLRNRPPKGLLGGMTEFPTTEWGKQRISPSAIKALAPNPSHWREAGLVTHIFTHFALELLVFVCEADVVRGEGFWCPISNLPDQALPSVMRKCAEVARAAMEGLAL